MLNYIFFNNNNNNNYVKVIIIGLLLNPYWENKKFKNQNEIENIIIIITK